MTTEPSKSYVDPDRDRIADPLLEIIEECEDQQSAPTLKMELCVTFRVGCMKKGLSPKRDGDWRRCWELASEVYYEPSTGSTDAELSKFPYDAFGIVFDRRQGHAAIPYLHLEGSLGPSGYGSMSIAIPTADAGGAFIFTVIYNINGENESEARTIQQLLSEIAAETGAGIEITNHSKSI